MKTLIVSKENPILRQKAKEVHLTDISSKKIKEIIHRMKTALAKEDDGVAIAAPQIGEPLKIFVVSGKVFSKNYPEIKPDEKTPEDLVCINPEIFKLSRQKKKMSEGCLSIRWLYGDVLRSTKATIKAYDEKGVRFTRGGAGIIAQIFQHETDHLNGVLFTDKAENIENVPPEEIKNKNVKI